MTRLGQRVICGLQLPKGSGGLRWPGIVHGTPCNSVKRDQASTLTNDCVVLNIALPLAECLQTILVTIGETPNLTREGREAGDWLSAVQLA